MTTKVYKFNLEAMNNSEQWIEQHPEAYLFTYEDDFTWEWYTISVGGKNYRFCMGDVSTKPVKNYFVEEFNFRPEMDSMSTHGTAYCPACGHSLDWECEDGLCTCDECHSKVEKRTFVYDDWNDQLTADYHTHLVELRHPHKLDEDKIKMEVQV